MEMDVNGNTHDEHESLIAGNSSECGERRGSNEGETIREERRGEPIQHHDEPL